MVELQLSSLDLGEPVGEVCDCSALSPRTLISDQPHKPYPVFTVNTCNVNNLLTRHPLQVSDERRCCAENVVHMSDLSQADQDRRGHSLRQCHLPWLWNGRFTPRNPLTHFRFSRRT
jgi:hypothetical protein